VSISRTPHAVGASRRNRVGLGRFYMQPRAGVSFDPGALVVARYGSVLGEIPDPSAPRPDLVLIGTFVGTGVFTASSTADANGGSLDAHGAPETITVEPLSGEGTGDFATGTSTHQITSAHRDAPAFMYDNDTYYPDDLGGTLSFGGWVGDVLDNGRVMIKHSAQLRVLYELYSAGQATPGSTSDDDVRTVATSLPAGTFSGGVLTLTATGAFSTAQDGVTLAVGDKFIIPVGTITTLVVSAANSGVYEVTSLGATGVSASFTRTARWAQGAIIKPGTRVRVGGEPTIFHGTTWRAEPVTAAKVVGTDDPLLFPERVIVQKTCSSGTASIATVPLRAAGKFSVLCDYNGGTPAATTTSIQASTQTPGGIGTASIVIQEQSVLGTLVNTGTATCAVTIIQ